jgi:predicted ArsR family transcriptional regulator
MESTRARIVELLRERGTATVEDLTRVLGVAPATVRRHLDVLQRDGYVERQTMRRPTGRPHYLFRLTQTGQDLTPSHYVGATGLLLSQLLSLTAADTRGKDGAAVALLAFDRMNQTLFQSCEPRVTATSLPDRLQQAVEALAAGGLMLETASRPDGFVVTVRDCPCRCAETVQEAVCLRSSSMLGRLLGTELRRDPTAEKACSYFVRV